MGISALKKTESFTLAAVLTHHGDAEAPYVRLDTVALLVKVWVDPLGLKDHKEGKNHWLCIQRVINKQDTLLQEGSFSQAPTLTFLHPLLAQGRNYTTSPGL